MSLQRELALFMVSVYDKTDDNQKMISEMKKVIQIDPKLNENEQNLLSYCFKCIYCQIHFALNQITKIIEKEVLLGNKLHVEALNRYKIKLMNEEENLCNEIIKIIDDQLLPFTNDDYLIFLYQNTKARFYCYLFKNCKELGIIENAYKAKECYDKALNYANKKLTPDQKIYLGFYYNYTIFLYEIMGQKIEAIDIAKKTFDKCVDECDKMDENDLCVHADCTCLLQLLKDNIDKWSNDLNLSNE